jgi:hypothetical protein
MRSFIAILAAAFIGLAFAPTAASARPFGGGGFHGGGFHGGGFHGGGFRGGGFRHGGFGHRGFGFPLAGAAVGLGLAAGSPYWGGYGYGYDECLVPRRVWTPYGWRRHWINVCY